MDEFYNTIIRRTVCWQKESDKQIVDQGRAGRVGTHRFPLPRLLRAGPAELRPASQSTRVCRYYHPVVNALLLGRAKRLRYRAVHRRHVRASVLDCARSGTSCLRERKRSRGYGNNRWRELDSNHRFTTSRSKCGAWRGGWNEGAWSAPRLNERP